MPSARAVATQVERHDPEPRREPRCHLVPGCRLLAKSVEQHHCGRVRVARQLAADHEPVRQRNVPHLHAADRTSTSVTAVTYWSPPARRCARRPRRTIRY